jgi:hypothetical protein
MVSGTAAILRSPSKVSFIIPTSTINHRLKKIEFLILTNLSMTVNRIGRGGKG